MKKFYLFLCVIGFLLPYSQFTIWLFENGLDVSKFFEAIVGSRIGLFAWLDVAVSAVVLIGFILSQREYIPRRAVVLSLIATLSVGVSFGLPLFLYFREKYKTY